MAIAPFPFCYHCERVFSNESLLDLSDNQVKTADHEVTCEICESAPFCETCNDTYLSEHKDLCVKTKTISGHNLDKIFKLNFKTVLGMDSATGFPLFQAKNLLRKGEILFPLNLVDGNYVLNGPIGFHQSNLPLSEIQEWLQERIGDDLIVKFYSSDRLSLRHYKICQILE